MNLIHNPWPVAAASPTPALLRLVQGAILAASDRSYRRPGRHCHPHYPGGGGRLTRQLLRLALGDILAASDRGVAQVATAMNLIHNPWPVAAATGSLAAELGKEFPGKN